MPVFSGRGWKNTIAERGCQQIYAVWRFFAGSSPCVWKSNGYQRLVCQAGKGTGDCTEKRVEWQIAKKSEVRDEKSIFI